MTHSTAIGEAMDLSGVVDDEPVSTGKTVVKSMTWDKEKADLVDDETARLAIMLPYVDRAIKYVAEQGFSICKSVKDALVRRSNGENVMTLHEADICLRGKVDFRNSFIQCALRTFGGYITEDGSDYRSGVFQLRARYNSGMKWYKEQFDKATPQQKKDGLARLALIRKQLELLSLPLHEEEQNDCIHPEFLKPEYQSWDLFAKMISLHTRGQSSVIAEEQAALEAEAKAALSQG